MRADTVRSRSARRAAAHETNKVEVNRERIMNKRLLPVFQAARPTIRRMITKTIPPVVTSRLKRRSSANADLVSGGTTSSRIRATKTSDTIAPVRARPKSPKLRASSVRIATSKPARTRVVPRIAFQQRERKDEGLMTKDEGSLGEDD